MLGMGLPEQGHEDPHDDVNYRVESWDHGLTPPTELGTTHLRQPMQALCLPASGPKVSMLLAHEGSLSPPVQTTFATRPWWAGMYSSTYSMRQVAGR